MRAHPATDQETSTTPFRVHHIAINVRDLKRSIDFYEDLVGLRLTDRDDHSAKLAIGSAELVLFQLPSDIDIESSNNGDHPLSLNHIAFEIHPALFEKYHKLLIDKGVKITFGPVKRRHGYALYFLDPDGNKIELFYTHYNRNGY